MGANGAVIRIETRIDGEGDAAHTSSRFISDADGSNEKETGLPKYSPVMEEMSPFTLWNEVDSFCQTTVPPVGMDKAMKG